MVVEERKEKHINKKSKYPENRKMNKLKVDTKSALLTTFHKKFRRNFSQISSKYSWLSNLLYKLSAENNMQYYLVYIENSF